MLCLLRTVTVAAFCASTIFASPLDAAAAKIPIMYPYGDTLATGQSLLPGQGLISKNGYYSLVLQNDGNLVEYFLTSTATWASHTQGRTVDHLTLSVWGGLALYDHDDQEVWGNYDYGLASGSNTDRQLTLGDDGYIYATTRSTLWSFGAPFVPEPPSWPDSSTGPFTGLQPTDTVTGDWTIPTAEVADSWTKPQPTETMVDDGPVTTLETVTLGA